MDRTSSRLGVGNDGVVQPILLNAGLKYDLIDRNAILIGTTGRLRISLLYPGVYGGAARSMPKICIINI